ncbi:MAG: zinc ribbon domain-containing protein [Bacteroidales bacterium]|nr:zinc ribbon domain-containing protein [Bacteroidales bacterium]
MVCPNCKVELKADASFCHECGYPLQKASEQESQEKNQQLTSNVDQPSNRVQDNSVKIDVSHFTVQNWIFFGVAVLGALGCLLPWARVNVFFYVASINGMKAWQGVVSFILFLGIIAYMFLEKALKIDEKSRHMLKMVVNVAVPGLITLLLLLVLIDILSTNMVSPSIGIFLSIASSVFLILMGLNIVKFNK